MASACSVLILEHLCGAKYRPGMANTSISSPRKSNFMYLSHFYATDVVMHLE